MLDPVTAGLEGPDEEEPIPKPARDNPENGDPLPAELELSRRKESLCCLFSLSRDFFSTLFFTPLPPGRNRWPVVSILTGEIPLDEPPEVLLGVLGKVKPSACDEVREKRLTPDVCLDIPPDEGLCEIERAERRELL